MSVIYIIENGQELYLSNISYDFDNFPTYWWTTDIRMAKTFLNKPDANEYRQKIIKGKKEKSLDSDTPLGRISVGKYTIRKVK